MNTNFKTENVVYVVVGMLAAALLLFVAIPLLSTEKIFDTAKGTSLGVLVVHADDGGAEGGAGGGGGAGDAGSGGSDGSGTDGGATGGASGGGGCCGGEPGTSADSGSVGDFGGSEVTVAYTPYIPPIVHPHWVPYCTGGNDPNGNNWQWWEKTTNTNPIQYRFVRMGDGSCVPPTVTPAHMTGSISATVGACVPGVPKRYVDVSWQTQNAQLTVAQAAGGQYGGGINLISPTSNNSGSQRLEVSAGAYVFAVAGHNTSWVTLQNVHRVITTDECVPTTIHWTPYCTMGNDPNGNNWQWWEYSDTNPVQYRFLRAGDGVCVPPQQPNPVCPVGTSGTYPNCIVIHNNNNNTNNNTNNNNNVITINNPAPQTQVIYRDRDSRSRSYSGYNDYRYNDYDACTITVSPSVVAYGQATTLSWSSNSGNSGWIEGVGSVSAYGSMQTTPTRSGVYTGRFVGYNGHTITCSAYITVSGAYVPPAYNTPYVSLASVPYTGLELGPYGTVIYWSFLILWCLFAAYLIAVKKIQNNIASWFVGKGAAAAHTHETHAQTHEVHVEHNDAHKEPTHTHTHDTVDAFIAQQLKLVQK